tara:strand:- start:116 stop:553 length:438 start_codon:yes stop_codon:yes gene_type:complete
MPLRVAWEVEAWIQPALIREIRIEHLLHLRLWRKGAGFQHFRLQAHQYGRCQESFTAVGEVTLIAPPPSLQGFLDLAGDFDALPQLIKKAIHNSNDIHIPWVKITLLCCILKQADGEPGTGISSLIQPGIHSSPRPSSGKIPVMS